jgi:hypothetical protein
MYRSLKVSEWLASVSGDNLPQLNNHVDRRCGIVVSVPGFRSRGPGSIPGYLEGKVSAPV